MNAKVVITLILGLVFQLAQVLPGAVTPASCAPHSLSCKCCAEGGSCHCSANNAPDTRQAPKPAVPDSQAALKVMLAKSGDKETLEHPASTIASSATMETTFRRGPPAGFEGVRLSVAFCSIVI